jgi:hypothetical protein
MLLQLNSIDYLWMYWLLFLLLFFVILLNIYFFFLILVIFILWNNFDLLQYCNKLVILHLKLFINIHGWGGWIFNWIGRRYLQNDLNPNMYLIQINFKICNRLLLFDRIGWLKEFSICINWVHDGLWTFINKLLKIFNFKEKMLVKVSHLEKFSTSIISLSRIKANYTVFNLFVSNKNNYLI